MYKHLKYLSTKDMTHDEWEEMRRGIKTIGGSDAPTILGLNEFSSAYQLWCQKTGKIVPEDISGKEAVRLGTDLEQYVAQRFEEATGKKLRRRNAVITNPDYPFAHANVDRLVVGEDAGFEAKTTSSWEIAAECREGKIPARYYAQMFHYLAITGAARWYLGVLVFGVGFFHFTVERDDAEIRALMDAERSFWDGVCNLTPPPIDGSQATADALKTVFAESANNLSADLTAVGHHIDAYNALTEQISKLEEMKREHENSIKAFMGEAERGIYGGTTVSWKSSSRKTFDKAAYEAANGKIADNWYKTSDTRTFRVTKKG